MVSSLFDSPRSKPISKPACRTKSPTPSQAGDAALASVAIGRPVRGEFTYLVPEHLEGKLWPGQRVRVPFGRTAALGFYLGPAAAQIEPSLRLKAIERELEAEPALPADLIALLRFAAEHYRYPLGEAIRAALPPGLSALAQSEPVPPDAEFVAQAVSDRPPEGLERAPNQQAVLSYLLAVGGPATVAEIAPALPAPPPPPNPPPPPAPRPLCS